MASFHCHHDINSVYRCMYQAMKIGRFTVPLEKETRPLKNAGWKMKFPFEMVPVWGHVNFSCSSSHPMKDVQCQTPPEYDPFDRPPTVSWLNWCFRLMRRLGSLTFDVTTVRFLYVSVNASNTVDGRHPAPPGMYKTY